MKSERTLFFPLELKGVGTGDVESLRSYAERLSLAHRLNPTTLMGILLVRMPFDGHTGARIGYRVTQHWEVHGGGDVALQLAERLSLATTCDVTCSTLARLKAVLSPVGLALGRRQSRYCPLCVAPATPGELPYGRLLWMIRSVVACPMHRVRLRDAGQCGAAETSRLMRTNRPSLQGVCNQCGSIGFKCLEGNELEDAADAEVWVAEQAAALIALLPNQANGLSPKTFRNGLRAVLDARFEGQSVKPSLAAGLARSTVWSWVEGERVPTLEGLMKFCAHAQCNLVPLLAGSFEPSSGRALRTEEPTPRAYRRNPLDESDIRGRLCDAASCDSPPSATRLATEMDMDIKQLRLGFPEEYQALLEARRTHMERESQRRYEAYEAEFSAIAEALSARGAKISSQKVLQEAGMHPYYLLGNRRTAMDAVMTRLTK